MHADGELQLQRRESAQRLLGGPAGGRGDGAQRPRGGVELALQQAPRS